MYSPIGIFDSGFGGLTILQDIQSKLPQYDYLYLGDNARAPYGNRSFEAVYEFTLQAVDWFFKQNCSLVILACNTASAKALRTIQQNNLPAYGAHKRVLGVIRPTAETIGQFTTSKHVGILATLGTVRSQSYPLEIQKFYPELTCTQLACPLLVPLIENGELDNEGTNYFVKKYLHQLLEADSLIDTILLGCTHYPLLQPIFEKHLPAGVKLLLQGPIVADSLVSYLQRHPNMEKLCSTGGTTQYFTTDTADVFLDKANLFNSQITTVQSVHL